MTVEQVVVTKKASTLTVKAEAVHQISFKSEDNLKINFHIE